MNGEPVVDSDFRAQSCHAILASTIAAALVVDVANVAVVAAVVANGGHVEIFDILLVVCPYTLPAIPQLQHQCSSELLRRDKLIDRVSNTCGIARWQHHDCAKSNTCHSLLENAPIRAGFRRRY